MKCKKELMNTRHQIKYNPKLENKSKTIPLNEVKGSVKEMQTVAFGQEINTNQEDLKQIDTIPLKNRKREN